jgi:hypothetical protein
MNIIKQIEQLSRLHSLLVNERTGTPGQLSRRLGMSRSKLYVVINDLRAHGAMVAYSRKGQTFYYENEFLVDIRCVLRPLAPGEKGQPQIVRAGPLKSVAATPCRAVRSRLIQ